MLATAEPAQRGAAHGGLVAAQHQGAVGVVVIGDHGQQIVHTTVGRQARFVHRVVHQRHRRLSCAQCGAGAHHPGFGYMGLDPCGHTAGVASALAGEGAAQISLVGGLGISVSVDVFGFGMAPENHMQGWTHQGGLARSCVRQVSPVLGDALTLPKICDSATSWQKYADVRHGLHSAAPKGEHAMLRSGRGGQALRSADGQPGARHVDGSP
ncbi:hypothetical protein THIX_30493 [Thiomonas sp. X19]|nr:hypothetical protein THIX_30493 [Thiomonas sp. X19]